MRSTFFWRLQNTCFCNTHSDWLHAVKNVICYHKNLDNASCQELRGREAKLNFGQRRCTWYSPCSINVICQWIYKKKACLHNTRQYILLIVPYTWLQLVDRKQLNKYWCSVPRYRSDIRNIYIKADRFPLMLTTANKERKQI
jgi:hypothetical protein